jgi:hypothetical protein
MGMIVLAALVLFAVVAYLFGAESRPGFPYSPFSDRRLG